MYQMQVPTLSRVNKIIIITSVLLFLINSILGSAFNISMVNLIGLSSATVLKGYVYQFITFPFIEVSFISILFNCLILWFIGSELEQRWGRKFYNRYLLLTVLVTGVIYFLVSLVNTNMMYVPLKGLGGINFALLVAYALIFSERQLTFMLLFPMKAKYFCMLLAGVEIYMSLFSAYKYSAWAHIIAMAFGYFYLRYASLRAQMHQMKDKKHKERMRKKLKIVKDDDEPKIWH